MTTYTWPTDLIPDQMTFALRTNSKAFISPLSGAVQAVNRDGSRWHLRMSFPRLDSVKRRRLQGFIAKLNGQEHRFTVNPWTHPLRGVATGTPLVNGASQTGTTLTTDGWTNSVTGILLTGDLIQVGTQLVMLAADASSNGAGQATLDVRPGIRVAPADNAAIVVASGSPIGIFMPAPGTLQDVEIIAGPYGAAVIEAIEDVLA